jgi:hypothetical protein
MKTRLTLLGTSIIFGATMFAGFPALAQAANDSPPTGGQDLDRGKDLRPVPLADADGGPEIVVTGSRLTNEFNSSTPVQIITAASIQARARPLRAVVPG